MALIDPQSINSVSVPRTGTAENGATYRSADGTAVFSIQHAYGRRVRRTVRYEHAKIAADPLTAQNARVGATVYMVVDAPREGYTVAEQNALVTAFAAWLTASTGANMAKVLGGES